MERNPQTVFSLTPEEASLITKRHLYFNGDTKESEFAALPGNLQRAINREAEFHVKALAQTEGFHEILKENDFAKAQEFHNALCEYFAHIGNQEEKLNPFNPNNKFKRLAEADAKAIYNNNTEFSEKTPETFDKATRRAKHYNHEIAKRHEQGRQTNQSEFFNNLMSHLKNFGKSNS